MLSRFSLCGAQGVKKCFLKFQPAVALATAAPAKIPPEYPPPTSKRDHVNFPRLSVKERAPPVRLGFIPESWFDMLYPKTGYTGPYMLLFTLGTYLYSKEILVIEHNMIHLYGFIYLLMFIHIKFGDKIGDIYNKLVDEEIKQYDDMQEEEKKYLKEAISFLEGKTNMRQGIDEIVKARTEIVHMQMEDAYRERVAEAYKTIKRKLDCEVELENVERRIAQKNVVDYVIKNVMKSITPDLEKNAMQTCISDLNALASKA